MKNVVVESVVWEGRRGGAIFRATATDGSRHRIRAKSDVMPRPPVPGEVWEIDGVIRRHPVWGLQVEARSAALSKPSGRLIVKAIAESPLFPGIGAVYAQRLWDAFDESLYELLESGDRETIEEVLNPELAQVLVHGWRERAADLAVYRWLDRHGLPIWLSRKLLVIFGDEVIEKLEENPYRLLAFVSWGQTDKVGRSLGVPMDDPRRLVASAEAAVHRRLDEAHTWTTRGALLGVVAELLGGDAELASEALRLAQEAFALVETGEGLQGLGANSMEQFVASRVREMVGGGFLAEQLTFCEQPTHERVSEVLDAFDSRQDFRLNVEQRSAVWTAVANPLSCITGGAGVGKTTVLSAIHEVAEALCFSGVFQMALSGRASQRMVEKTGRPASTIASFLLKVDSGEVDLESGEYLLIIDEASMLDLPTCYRIFRRMSPGTRLVLVGDAAQLPPIGFGLTFHVLVGHPMVPTSELTEIHRAAASTGIPQASVAIRQGAVPALSEYAGDGEGVFFVDAPPSQVGERVAQIVADLGGDASCQVISATKAGPAGVMTINKQFHEALFTGADHLFGYAEGEPVLWKHNDYNRGLLNGSLGRVSGLGEHLVVAFDGERHELGEGDVGDYLDRAYAITVHKAQGSQFDRVVVPVFSNNLLDRTLIYTAVTRAARQVVLVGDRRAFERAVQAPPAPSIRETGMLLQLGGSLAA